MFPDYWYYCIEFKDVSPEKFEESPIIFGDFIKMGAADSDRMYEDLMDMKKLFAVLSEVKISAYYHVFSNVCNYLQYLDDFNMSSSKEMKLVFFMDAIEHVSRYVSKAWVSFMLKLISVLHTFNSFPNAFSSAFTSIIYNSNHSLHQQRAE